FDFKLADGEAHRRYTGADNALILDNLAFLSRAGAAIALRCPIIPDVNLTDGHFEAIARTAATHGGVRWIDLEPYHPLGLEKARRLGRAAGYDNESFLSREALEARAQWLREAAGVPVNIV
ncbi:MAG: glycyl-radical enzyme activating protein, partial [Clostridia bacterium]|nr:glycyl-radical enzyme activating protein [Clostridia bacterium]